MLFNAIFMILVLEIVHKLWLWNLRKKYFRLHKERAFENLTIKASEHNGNPLKALSEEKFLHYNSFIWFFLLFVSYS